MSASEIGHDMSLFRIFKTPCSSVSLQRLLRMSFNHHSTKVWEIWPNHKLLSSAQMLFGWPGNKVFSPVFLSINRHNMFDVVMHICLSVKLCVLKESTSTATPLCCEYLMTYFFPFTNLSMKYLACCLLFSHLKNHL